MNKLRHTRTMDVTVLMVMMLYFLVATTHIFFITQQHGQVSKIQMTGNSIFKRKTEMATSNAADQVLIKRPDKSTFEEKNIVTDVLNSAAGFFILLFFLPSAWLLKISFPTRSLDEARLPHHTFLSLQIIRI
ncbi:hypothetical protein SNE26_20605 [Mucilaginibacter sp. cycad4]|uniref:hypothetical protein n=1 Tax=Mucilaginibacter sp. cycad4 TaxID=3342096 RepID=UPI002AABCFBB|nr:hypothetical protein [Mucilaginibacter gossypii]WPU98430.1 hypothetical protein SNE26_20605 [Mucilaginibacter gossypii]